MARETAELRVEVPREELDTLDGSCQGHGLDRSTVVRQIVADWSKRQRHVATVICRVARINPLATDPGRNGGGKGGES